MWKVKMLEQRGLEEESAIDSEGKGRPWKKDMQGLYNYTLPMWHVVRSRVPHADWLDVENVREMDVQLWVNQTEKKASGEEGNEKEAVMEIFEPLLQVNENRPSLSRRRERERLRRQNETPEERSATLTI